MGLDKPAQLNAGGIVSPYFIAQVHIGDTTYRIRRHPELMRVPYIKTWAEEYLYTEHYKVPVKFEDRHPRWIKAKNIFSFYYKGASEWLIRTQSNK